MPTSGDVTWTGRGIKTARAMAETQMRQLGDAAGNRDALEALIEEETVVDEDDSKGEEARKAAQRAAMLNVSACRRMRACCVTWRRRS